MQTGKLGRLAPVPHPKTLKFSLFRTFGDTSPAPPKRAWEYHPDIEKAGWGMYGNDEKNCCTLSSKAHIIMAATANNGHLVVPDPAEIMAIYDHLSPDDSGLAMTTVYDYWLQHPIAGQKLLGWLQFDQTNRSHFSQVINLFGHADVGIMLSQAALDQSRSNHAWDLVSNDGGILGGHCVPYFGFGSQGETCVTWGHNQPTGIPYFQRYCEEAFALILDGWFDAAGKTPAGFNRDQLWNALKALKA